MTYTLRFFYNFCRGSIQIRGGKILNWRVDKHVPPTREDLAVSLVKIIVITIIVILSILLFGRFFV